MKTPALVAVAVLLAACGTLMPSDESARSLAQAETAFAAQSMREDMRAAFIAHFAEDGVFVRNEWVNTRAWLEKRPAPPIVLDWRPQYVEVARSGDMGLSTGPWKLTPRDKAGEAAYGQFVSIWTRKPGGPWKVRVDLGIPHEKPLLWDAPLVARTTPAMAGAETLPAAEAEFERLSREDSLAAAYRARGAADLRLYRDAEAPQASIEAALASPRAGSAKLEWRAEFYDAAASGDFGYVYGSYSMAPSKARAGRFLRVWRRETAGWRIFMDVVNPTPAA